MQAVLRLQIRSCRAQISELTAELETEIDANRMTQVQQAIAALLEQLLLIREKARESENVVKEITRDIRSLDIAKRNVVSSMTALKRLQMLVNGVDQLQRLAETKRYREAASALQAVRSLLDFFQSYRGVERIASAWKQVNELQNNLRTVIMKDYENFFLHDPNRSVRSTNLPESALVIDAIGSEAKAALIDWYCSLQLREYRRIFRATDEAGQLDNVSRRFAWFRRILKVHEDEHAPAFPEHWKAERWLIRRFAEVTKEDLRSVLIREQSRLNVSTLMEALNSTLEFEAAISRKYNTSFEELIAPPGASANGPSQMQQASQPSQQQLQVQAQSQQPTQTLSAIFDPYLGVFVEAQDRALAEMFVQYRRQGARSHMMVASVVTSTSQVAVASEATTHSILPMDLTLRVVAQMEVQLCFRLLRNCSTSIARHWNSAHAFPIVNLCVTCPRSIANGSVSTLKMSCVPLLYDRSPSAAPSMCGPTSARSRNGVWCSTRLTTVPARRVNSRTSCERGFMPTTKRPSVSTGSATFSLLWFRTLSKHWRGSSNCARSLSEFDATSSCPWSQLQPRANGISASAAGKSQYVMDMASLLEQIGVVVRQDVENKRYVRSWCDRVVSVLTTRFLQGLVRLRL